MVFSPNFWTSTTSLGSNRSQHVGPGRCRSNCFSRRLNCSEGTESPDGSDDRSIVIWNPTKTVLKRTVGQGKIQGKNLQETGERTCNDILGPKILNPQKDHFRFPSFTASRRLYQIAPKPCDFMSKNDRIIMRKTWEKKMVMESLVSMHLC